jgi:hypothetical protein
MRMGDSTRRSQSQAKMRSLTTFALRSSRAVQEREITAIQQAPGLSFYGSLRGPRSHDVRGRRAAEEWRCLMLATSSGVSAVSFKQDRSRSHVLPATQGFMRSVLW